MSQTAIEEPVKPTVEVEQSKKINKVSLVMIVKNEARKIEGSDLTVIERCLSSVRPVIDTIVICDTGSTDGTQEVIKSWAEKAGLESHVIDREWQDFGTTDQRHLSMQENLPMQITA